MRNYVWRTPLGARNRRARDIGYCSRSGSRASGAGTFSRQRLSRRSPARVAIKFVTASAALQQQQQRARKRTNCNVYVSVVVVVVVVADLVAAK